MTAGKRGYEKDKERKMEEAELTTEKKVHEKDEEREEVDKV